MHKQSFNLVLQQKVIVKIKSSGSLRARQSKFCYMMNMPVQLESPDLNLFLLVSVSNKVFALFF